MTDKDIKASEDLNAEKLKSTSQIVFIDAMQTYLRNIGMVLAKGPENIGQALFMLGEVDGKLSIILEQQKLKVELQEKRDELKNENNSRMEAAPTEASDAQDTQAS